MTAALGAALALVARPPAGAQGRNVPEDCTAYELGDFETQIPTRAE